MMPAFEAWPAPKLHRSAFIGPSGRRSTAEEQAWPLGVREQPPVVLRRR